MNQIVQNLLELQLNASRICHADRHDVNPSLVLGPGAMPEYSVNVWRGTDYVSGRGATVSAALDHLRTRAAELDPVERLKKEASALGCRVVRIEDPAPLAGDMNR